MIASYYYNTWANTTAAFTGGKTNIVSDMIGAFLLVVFVIIATYINQTDICKLFI